MWGMSSKDQKTQQVQQPKMPPYVWKKADYVRQIDTFQLCEIQGRRAEQQDAMATSHVENFLDLSNAQRIDVLRDTIKEMQGRYNVHPNELSFGATLSMSIAWIKDSILHIWAANLGDSAAYVIIFDDENNSSITYRLTYPHALDPKVNLAEYERVQIETNYKQPQQDKHGTYRLDATGRGLMPSRSLGDNDVECYGLSHEPEIFEYRFVLTTTQRAKVIVACDGLEDGRFGVLQINQSLYDSDKQNTNSAAALVTAAYQSRSTDNISVTVFTPSDVPASALVVDGHSGDLRKNTALIFANEIASDFYHRFQANIKMTILAPDEVVPDYVKEVYTQYVDFFSQSATFYEIQRKIKFFLDNEKKIRNGNGICLEVAGGVYRGGDAIKDSYQQFKNKMILIQNALRPFLESFDRELKVVVQDPNGVIQTSKKLLEEMPFSRSHRKLDAQYIAELQVFSDLKKILNVLPVRLIASEDPPRIELVESLQPWIEKKIAELLTQYFKKVESQKHYFSSKCAHATLFKDKLATSSHFSISESDNNVLLKNSMASPT